MKIAILGGTSQIAQDLMRQWKINNKSYQLTIYSRRMEVVQTFMESILWDIDYTSHSLAEFESTSEKFDAIINFIGQGSPVNISNYNHEIMAVTALYDDAVMKYLSYNPACKYIFLSSGSVYGALFQKPVTENSYATIPINDLSAQNNYAIAKIYAEANHRLNKTNTIIDIRIFNVFSRHQNLDAGFFITDIAKAICYNTKLNVSAEHMIRDFLHPHDFFTLIELILVIKDRKNMAIDCYSKGPIEKFALLDFCTAEYGLQWEVKESYTALNPTGNKSNYYSTNRNAALIGFQPLYSSLDTIITEINALRNSF